jgi:hypothetical protein
MTEFERFMQSTLIIPYPLFAALAISLWGVFRISRTGLSVPHKLIRIGYVVLLGLCVFPGSFYLLVISTDPCTGQGSELYYGSHPLLCQYEVVLGVPWWVPVLYTLDILVLIWSIKRLTEELKWNFRNFALPLLYYFIVRIGAMYFLQLIEQDVHDVVLTFYSALKFLAENRLM